MISNPSISGHDIQTLLQRINCLPDNISDNLHHQVLSAEFRSAVTLYEQITILKKNVGVSFSTLAVVYGMKKTTLYSLYKKAKIELEEPQTSHITNNFAATNCKLSIEEEKLIIEYIEERQRNFDCLSIKELCSYATHLMKMRNPEAEDLSHSWWKSFKRGHSSVLTPKMVDSRELSRTKVKYEEVIEYYGKIVHALAHINSPKQIINMDETGFASRSEK